MKKKSTVVLLRTGMAAAGILAAAGMLASEAAKAAPTAISDSALSQITGKSNSFTFGSGGAVTTTSITSSNDNSANIQFGWYQWSDSHAGDTSDHKGANDQSGTSSAVQQNVTGQANSLVWGAIGQDSLINAVGTFTSATPTGTVGSIAGSQTNMAYGVFAGGGF